MKKIFIWGLITLLFLPFTVKAVDTSGECVIAYDQNSGRVFYEKNMHKQRPIASISKIMTALLAVESNKLNEDVTIGDEIVKAYGSGVYIQQGEVMKLEDLVFGLMLRSGNDAALAIAKYVGGSVEEFITMMNSKAQELGMKDSKFNNPSGLDDEGGNLSSAYDMAVLMSYAMNNEDFKTIVGTKKRNLKTNMNTYSWTNKNKLLFQYKYTTGGKTGFTDVAKRTLVSTASKDNLDVVVVTLNDGNDWQDHTNLYDEIFANYKNYVILEEGTVDIMNENYYKDSHFYLANQFTYPLNENEKNSVVLKFKMDKLDNYKDHDKVGKVGIYLGEEKLKEEDIFIVQKKQKTGFWAGIIAWFRNLW